MADRFPELRVQMFGKFILTWEGRVVRLGRNSTTKATQLLAALLYFGERGIPQADLLGYLYGEADSDRSLRNLYSCVRYLKDMLAKSPLPKHEYIVLKKGIYRWDAPMETVIDAKRFVEMTKDARAESREDVERLEEACRIYRREFLPDFSDQEWVLLENMRLKHYYTDTVNQVSAWLMHHDEYEEAYRLAEQAASVYPFDEWQAVAMQCLICMGRLEDAVAEYQKTRELMRKELDVEPSERMQKLLQLAKKGRSDWAEQSFADALGQLRENGKDANLVYYCDLPGFRDTYRMIARRIGCNEKPASLMLLGLDADGEQERGGAREFEEADEALKQSIRQSLRRTDVFTRCSNTQYLVLLYGVGEKDGKNIACRIRSGFLKSWRGKDCLSISIAPVEPTGVAARSTECRRIDDIKC